jgi:tetratricopeptide (TPR) repeat protein
MGVKAIAPRYLEIPEVLDAVGITESTAGATYVVEMPSGDRVTVELEAIPDGWLPRLGTRPYVLPSPADRVAMVYGRGTPERPQPMYLSDPGNRFWYEWLDDSRTLYVQLNAILNKDDESMESFFDRVFQEADSRPIDRLVIDLRFNGGGNNFNNFPVIRGIVRRHQIDEPGKLFVITSRHTFSAASHLVTYLERQTDVLFVGEPTGASPNHYGDAGLVELPNSGLRARASEIYWQNSLPSRFDSRDWTAPDISTPMTIEDYLTGRDPAMEAIMAYAAAAPIEDQVLAALESGGPEEAKATFQRYVSDPTHEFVNVEGTMNTLGYELLGENRVDAAIAVFEFNAETYPESANVFDSLGDGYRARGDTEAAIESYKKALEVDPNFGPSRENLAALLGQ